ncbi:hypothetical protein [Maribacter sp.]|uniref:hypothetical protein n=1 Tax=Maribacter sp. TaxID=1897614 RepID=UPI0025B820D8|nr:hypothetical protein [Maribacter sp.]
MSKNAHKQDCVVRSWIVMGKSVVFDPFTWVVLQIMFVSELKVKVMKNLIFSLVVFVSTVTTVLGNNSNPESSVTIMSNEKVECTIESSENSEFLLTAEYNSKSEVIDFNTKDEVSFVQIFSEDGKMQYQLPVMSNKIKLSLKIFDENENYRLGFLINKNSKIHFTTLKVN